LHSPGRGTRSGKKRSGRAARDRQTPPPPTERHHTGVPCTSHEWTLWSNYLRPHPPDRVAEIDAQVPRPRSQARWTHAPVYIGLAELRPPDAGSSSLESQMPQATTPLASTSLPTNLVVTPPTTKCRPLSPERRSRPLFHPYANTRLLIGGQLAGTRRRT